MSGIIISCRKSRKTHWQNWFHSTFDEFRGHIEDETAVSESLLMAGTTLSVFRTMAILKFDNKSPALRILWNHWIMYFLEWRKLFQPDWDVISYPDIFRARDIASSILNAKNILPYWMEWTFSNTDYENHHLTNFEKTFPFHWQLLLL